MAQIAIYNSIGAGTTGSGIKSTALEAAKCQFTSYSIDDFWRSRFEAQATALMDSEKSKYRVVKTLGSTDLAAFANQYYGSYLIGPTGTIAPSALTLSKVYEPERDHLKYEEFKRRQDAGEILLSPTLNRSIKVTANPGIPLSSVTATTQMYVQHSTLFRDQFPNQPSGCSSWPTRRWDGQEGFFRNTIPGTTVGYQRYTFAGALAVPVDELTINQWVNSFWFEVSKLEVDSGLVTEARSEAAAGIMDLSTAIAEMPETLKMIFEALRLILAKYLECRRKIDILRMNKINQADLMSQISALWMQYRYGIMPNVYTVYDGLAYLESEVVQYQSVRKGMNDFELAVPPVEGWSCQPVDIVHRIFLKNRFAISNLTKSTAFLKTNLLVTGWELIPLSFVVDWVFNVGDFLSSLMAPTGSIQEASTASWQGNNLKLTLVNPSYIQGTIDVDVGFYRADLIKPIDHIGLNVMLSVNVKRALDSLALAWGFTSADFKRKLRRRR